MITGILTLLVELKCLGKTVIYLERVSHLHLAAGRTSHVLAPKNLGHM